ncbi:NAD(P)/FAD-dependent oxidoreductase [Nesterenkonia sp. F]|uniref:phytoene desaturase family protein n=1 Tax=Nesterenkonia sp. F TaxID=795955 RepID=UPI000255D09B|nr:NAD(P)/FAD-dependent oxidoreductase [Nesterenkonia sp. F]
MTQRSVAVVGSGPNGLTAACVLARAGWEVTVHEAAAVPGGAMRSQRLLSDDVVSDLGASVHPIGAASPAFAALDLASHGLEWVHAPIPAAHALDDEPPALLHDSLQQTAAALGEDAGIWRLLMGGPARRWDSIADSAFGPPFSTLDEICDQLRSNDPHGTARLAAMASLGARGAWPASAVLRLFGTERAKALFAGLAAHSTAPFHQPLTGAFGVLFGAAAHSTGWPVARGGSQAIVDALLAELAGHGGRVETDMRVTGVSEVSVGSLPGAPTVPTTAPAGPRPRRVEGVDSAGRERSGRPVDVVLLDLDTRQLLDLEGLALPTARRRALRRWTHGPGIVKIDLLLDGEIPWRHPELGRASTVHLGGSGAQIAGSEAAASRGVLASRPYVLLAQPSAADATRAPAGQSVAWAYAHVPHGLSGRGVERAAAAIRAEIESQAPGFGARVLAEQVWSPQDLQSMDANLVGGSISGGVPTLPQFLARPTAGAPYTTGVDGVYLCSSSTPPGGGAHGMNGWHAAHAALQRHG